MSGPRTEQSEVKATKVEQEELKTMVEPVELKTTESQEAMVEQKQGAQRVGLKHGLCSHKREHREF